MQEPYLKAVTVGDIPGPLNLALINALRFTETPDLGKHTYKKNYSINKSPVHIGLFDTLPLQQKEERALHYRFARIFILVFDLNKPDSLKEIQEKYFTELQAPHLQKLSFATVLLGVRVTASAINTEDELITQASEFAKEQQIDVFMIRSLDNPKSIQEFIDLMTVAGLTKQPERIGLAQQCYEYLEHKKLEENFIDLCLTLTTALTPIYHLKLILFLIAKKMLGNKRSDQNINVTIDSLIEYAQTKPRTWNTANRLTLFKTNPYYTETKLHRDPEPRLSTTLFQR